MNKICVNCGPHDASVTILKDDKIIAHIQEERHTNITHDGSPIVSLTKVKDYIDKFDFVSFTHLFSQYIDPLPYMRTLQFMGGLDEKVHEIVEHGELLHNHHDYHAMCGFAGSGFEDAVVVIIDGAGSTFDYGKENQTTYNISLSKFDIIEKYIVGDGSVVDDSRPSYVKPITNIGAGYCYTAITECIGFGALECGKTMGLAPYGEDDSRIPELLSIDSGGNKSFTLGQNPRWPWMGDIYAIFNDSLLWQDPGKWEGKIKKVLGISDEEIEKDPKKYFKNIAYRIQTDYEKYLITTCERALSLSKSKNLVLSGGCALNCVANYKLLKSLPDDINLFIDPVSDDSGVSIGGLLHEGGITPQKLGIGFNQKYKWKDLYLGGQLQYEYELLEGENETDVVSKDVAELLIEGNIVAIAQGRSEIGPRALGNRSILFDPRVKNGKDIVNTVKKREFFRPFAGTVLLEHARDWFDMDRLEESPFMSYAIDVLPEKQDLIPSIVHFGTCRIQTVTRQQNKHYYDLISDFYKQTDVPILFNTSFNLSGDTIAETIDDALSTLRRSKIEYLYLPEINKLVYIPNK